MVIDLVDQLHTFLECLHTILNKARVLRVIWSLAFEDFSSPLKSGDELVDLDFVVVVKL